MLKKHYAGLFILLFNSLFASTGFAYETQFTTGTKPIEGGLIKGQKAAILSIPTADALEVSIRGEIHAKHDVLRVYTMKNGKTMQKIFEAKGKVEQVHPLIVEGDSIKVTLNSDKDTRRPGATVSIATLSPMTLMNRIKRQINQLLRNIERRGAAVAAAEIEKSSSRFQQLQKELQESNRSNELVKSVSEALIQLSYSYARIAELKDKIKKTNQVALNELKQLQEKTHQYAENTKARFQKEQAQITAWQQQLDSINDDLQRKKIEISIKAHQSLLKSLDVQYQVWQASWQTQAALSPRLETYFEHVDLLFYTLSLNADIYREAANVMQHNAAFAAETLSGLSNLQEVLQAVMNDWAEIGALQSRINEMGF